MTVSINMTSTTGGLDVPTLITQLMKAESIPLTNLKNQEASVQTEISSYGKLLSLNDTLDASLNSLKSPTTLSASALTTAVQSFISAYNDMKAGIKDQTGYKATLQGHFDVTSFGMQLGNTLFGQAGVGSINALIDMGIQVNNDGTLGLDTAKFTTALQNDPSSVNTYLTNVATGLEALTNPYTGSAKNFKTDQEGLQARVQTLQNRETAMQTRLDKKQAQYQSQFDAMQKALATINGNYGSASRILANLVKNSGNNN